MVALLGDLKVDMMVVEKVVLTVGWKVALMVDKKAEKMAAEMVELLAD